METEKDITAKLSLGKIIIPVLLGLGAATFLLWYNLNEVRFESVAVGTGQYDWFDTNGDGEIDLSDADEFVPVENGDYNQVTYKEILGKINWTWYSAFWFLMALICVVIRDAAYMYRIRVLTDKALSWRQSFDVIMIWEFASALTPSIVGGSGVALFILNREGIKLGKSTAIVMITALLDELFYISMVPLVLITIGTSNLFPVSMEREIFGITFGTQGIFWLGYGFIVLLTSIITLAIFYRPRAFKFLLIQIFRLPFLKRWRYNIIAMGNDIIIASKELKGKPSAFWAKAIVSTYFSWTARFIVVNMMIMAVLPVANHVLLYGRQLVMWVIMLISPTPGGSGIAEFAFSGFLADFIPLGLAGGMAFIWRLLTYYPYIFVGAIVLPRWLRRTGREIAIRKARPQAPQL
jgi:glycosyltransferase 2 family protein